MKKQKQIAIAMVAMLLLSVSMVPVVMSGDENATLGDENVTNITEANETNETVMEETVDKEPVLGIRDEQVEGTFVAGELKSPEFQTISERSATHSSDICLYDLLTGAETPVCINPEWQTTPAIYGDNIVWADRRNGNWDIYMYDYSLGVEMQVTTDVNDQTWPAIYGDKIVYIDNRHGNDDIYMYDLSTGTETHICRNPAIQLSPAIYGDKIAWLDYRNSPSNGFYYTDVYMYDLSTGTEAEVCIHDPHYQPSFWGGKYLSIYDDKIVWHDWRNGNADVYMHDLSTGVETPITTNTRDQSFPDIYEDKIVWQDNRNMPPDFVDTEYNDIYMYDLSTGVESPVSLDSETSERLPAIHGDKIVWSKGGDIYMYDLSTGTETPICTRPGLDWLPDIHGHRIVWDGSSPIEPNVKLLFVPLNWANTRAAFNSQVRTQTDFFINAIPLSACPEKVLVTALNVETQNFATFSCTYPTNCGVDSIRPFVNSLGINTADYDIIVGLAEASPCSPIAGCSNGRDTVWCKTTYDIVTAHEIGHIYGLEDEYCSNPAGSTDCRCNDGDMGGCCVRASDGHTICEDIGGDGAATGDVNWLDAALGCSPSGTPCCNWDASHDCAPRTRPDGTDDKGYHICCRGNQNALGGRCIMTYANAPGPRDYCAHCRDWLSTIPELNCHSPEEPASDQVIDLNILIYPDDTVKEEKIILRKGRPTKYYQRGEEFNLVVTGERGKVMWSQKFNIYFDYMGPVVSGVDYSGIRYEYFPCSYKIPYDAQMYELKLYHKEKVIFTKILNFCNNNGICESTETYLTCPKDCPLNQRDGICIPNSDGVCDPDCAERVDPDCVVEEAPKIFFSTEEDFVTQGPEPPDGNPIISDGDLLCSDCTVFARNRELLAAFQTEIDLGLDAADVIDIEIPMVTFSTELDDPQGRFTAGDLLATNGAVIPNIALLSKFDIPRDDFGLDAVHFIGDKEKIIAFLDYAAEKGKDFWRKNPDRLPTMLEEYDIDIWFSTEGTAPKPEAPRFLDGDLLSARNGIIIARNALLLPPSVPAGIPNRGVDFGLDAVTADRGGNRELIRFSTEILYEGELSFTDGDVLRIGNGVVRTNEDLIRCFEPKTNFLGLDALSVMVEEVCKPSIEAEKKVLDPIEQAWVEQITAHVDDTVTFKSVIHNDGTCCPLYDIKVTDILPDSLEYANNAMANGKQREPDEIGDKKLKWVFGGPLNPCETITIKFNARVVKCGVDINVQSVKAVCEETGEAVYDEDKATVVVPCVVRKPDLVITRIAGIGVVGEPLNIFYTIKNQGNAAAGPSYTGLWIGGKYIKKDYVGSLAPGAAINVKPFNYTWDCTPGEKVEIKVCADIADQVTESNEANNCKAETWTCAKKKPDLVIKDVKLSKEGDHCYVDYLISNTGTASAPASTTYLYVLVATETYTKVASDSTGSLASGASRWDRFTYRTTGTHTYKVCADGPNAISESNEANNCRTEKLTCPEVKKPDLVIKDIKLTKMDGYCYVDYLVSNTGTVSAAASTAYLYVDDKKVASDSTGSLAPGASRWDRFTAYRTTGTHTYKVCADGPNAISETNEGNNCRTEKLTCPLSLDIYFADAKEWPGSVYHYDTTTGIEETVYTRPSRQLFSFTFHPGIPEKLYYVNAIENKIYRTHQTGLGWAPEEVVYTHTTNVKDIAFAFDKDGKLGLYFSEANKIYKIEDSKASLYYEAELADFADVDGFWFGDFAFDDKNNLYLSSANRVPAGIYKVEGGEIKEIFRDEKEPITGLVYEDGALYYANYGTKIYRLDLTTGERTVVYSNPERMWLSDVGFREVITPEKPDLAYIYSTDTTSANSYKSLLDANGYSTTLLPMSDVATTDFSKYGLIIVGGDTGSGYHWGDAASVSAIQDSEKSIIGIYSGGASLFQELGLSTNWGHGMFFTESGIYVVKPNHTIFKSPNVILVPPDKIVQLYSAPCSVLGEYASSLSPEVLLLGRSETYTGHYPLVQEEQNVFWGFTASPESMTGVGKDLFINVVSYMTD